MIAGIFALSLAAILILSAIWGHFRPDDRGSKYIGLDEALRQVATRVIATKQMRPDDQHFSIYVVERLKEEVGRGNLDFFGRPFDYKNGGGIRERKSSRMVTADELDTLSIDGFMALKNQPRNICGDMLTDVAVTSDGAGWFQLRLERDKVNSIWRLPRTGIMALAYGK